MSSSQPKPTLLQALRSNMRLRHFSPRTISAYASWVRRFVRFHHLRHPAELGPAEVRAFLAWLAEDRRVAASTQTQALAALLLLYRDVVGRPPEALGPVPRARAPVRLPVVLTRGEVAAVLGRLEGVPWLVGMVLYGSGLRLMECLTLRIKDVDLELGEIRLRRGKGAPGAASRAGPGEAPGRSAGGERVGRVAGRAGAEVPVGGAELALAVALP